MSPEVFGRVMAILRTMRSAAPLDAETEMLYQAGISDLQDDEAMAAVVRCIREDEWRPAPATIRAKVIDTAMGALPKPTEVYETIIRLIQRYGIYGRREVWGHSEGCPPLPDVLTERVVEQLGGWKRCCLWEAEQGSFRKAITDATTTSLDRYKAELSGQLSLPPDQRTVTTRIRAQAQHRISGGLEKGGLTYRQIAAMAKEKMQNA